MDLDVLFWLVLIGIAVFAVSRAIGEPSRALSGMWGYREVLWPTGVQEDDDAHWSWTRVRRQRKAAPELTEMTTDPDDGDDRGPDQPDRPEVGRVRYEVRSAVDRARS